jgi:hypothetical protein
VLSLLASPPAQPWLAATAGGPGCVGVGPATTLGERLYRRLAAAAVREYPAGAVSLRDGAVSLADPLFLLQRLFPAGGTGAAVAGGGNTGTWLQATLSDPTVLRPGVSAPQRVAELASAVLHPDLGQYLFAVAVLDLSDAVRGQDAGRPAVTPTEHGRAFHGDPRGHPGHAGGPRIGAAASEEEDD